MAWYPIKGGENVTPEVTAQTGLIESIKTQLVGKATGANATADKILEGFSAWVNGQLVQGTAKDPSQFADLKSAGGFAKMAVDKFSFSSRKTCYGTSISHSLGTTPQIALLFCNRDSATANADVYFAATNSVCTLCYTRNTNASAGYGGLSYAANGNVGGSSVMFKVGSSNGYYIAGVEYTLITLA
jgi:hypothetical protein|nr:MAG TPA: hypothetical protein [Caudoviricetes sp.]